MLWSVLRIFPYRSTICLSDSPETSRACFRLGIGGGENEVSELLETVLDR